jgi:hypothetical protein
MEVHYKICLKSVLVTLLTVLLLAAYARGESDDSFQDEAYMPSEIDLLKIDQENQADHIWQHWQATPSLGSHVGCRSAIIPTKPIRVDPTPSDFYTFFPVTKQTVIPSQPQTTPFVFHTTRDFTPKPTTRRLTTRPTLWRSTKRRPRTTSRQRIRVRLNAIGIFIF